MLIIEFLSSDDVRRYARGELGPRKRRAVECALLDDDRARDLVRACAPVVVKNAPDNASAHAWRAALAACRASIAGHRQLLRHETPEGGLADLRQRLAEREGQFEQLVAAGEACGLEADAREPARRAAQAEVTMRLDGRAASDLKLAFQAIDSPYLKAQLADIISALEFDMERAARERQPRRQ